MPHDFLNEAKAHNIIYHFEEQWQKQNEQYSAQPILNNWCDNEHDGM